jgi:hypothetical protein
LIWENAGSKPFLIDIPYAELTTVSDSTAPTLISEGGGAALRSVAGDTRTRQNASKKDCSQNFHLKTTVAAGSFFVKKCMRGALCAESSRSPFDLREELPRPVAQRPREKTLRPVLFDDSSFVHENDACAHFARKLHFMGDDKHRGTLGGKPPNDHEGLFHQLRV